MADNKGKPAQNGKSLGTPQRSQAPQVLTIGGGQRGHSSDPRAIAQRSAPKNSSTQRDLQALASVQEWARAASDSAVRAMAAQYRESAIGLAAHASALPEGPATVILAMSESFLRRSNLLLGELAR